MFKEYFDLVGKYFIARDREHRSHCKGCHIRRYGRVVSQIGRDLYLIEFINPSDESPFQRFTTNSKGMDNWRWYDFFEEWREAWAAEHQAAQQAIV